MTKRTFTAADYERRAKEIERGCDCDSGPRMTDACSACRSTAAMLRQGAAAVERWEQLKASAKAGDAHGFKAWTVVGDEMARLEKERTA